MTTDDETRRTVSPPWIEVSGLYSPVEAFRYAEVTSDYATGINLDKFHINGPSAELLRVRCPLKVKYQDIEVGLDLDPEKGLADSGDLDTDFADLMAIVGEACAERNTAVLLFVDELQYVPEAQLAALITALHGASQAQLPITCSQRACPSSWV